MQSEYIVTSSQPSKAVVRLTAPCDVDRTPTHLVLLLDISESMLDQKKLENVKRCCTVVVDILNEHDHLSLLTFGNTASILLNRVSVDTSQREHIRSVIAGLDVDGCTNMSAGFLLARDVLHEAEKTGLLILTDGLANMGIVGHDSLQRILESHRQSFPQLSIHCVGYGTDHNADLLRSIAEFNAGSYNIVNSVEDTAFAFGDTLGGLMSCAAQNVTLTVPHNTIVQSPYKYNKTTGQIQIGDVYAGTKPIVFLEFPDGVSPESVMLTGVTVSDNYAPFTQYIEKRIRETREKEIELCKLRYECSEILTDIRNWSSLTATQKDGLSGRINTFEQAMTDSFLDGHPLTQTLRSEVEAMRDQLQRAQNFTMSRQEASQMAQRSCYIGLGRGFSTPVRPMRRQQQQQEEEEDDEPRNPATLPGAEAIFQNQLQSQIANALVVSTMTMDLGQ